MTPFHLISAMYQANLNAFSQMAAHAVENSTAQSTSELATDAKRGAATGNAPAKKAAQLCVDATYGSACWIADGLEDDEAANEPLKDETRPRMRRQVA